MQLAVSGGQHWGLGCDRWGMGQYISEPVFRSLSAGEDPKRRVTLDDPLYILGLGCGVDQPDVGCMQLFSPELLEPPPDSAEMSFRLLAGEQRRLTAVHHHEG